VEQERLACLLEQPEVQQRILGDYNGAYALGLVPSSDPGKVAIRVRIEGTDPSVIPNQVDLEGETVPILVHTGFKAPVPLKQA
jgi:hypothetical protein